jgi:GNAT superfamily N-acetyltransferase
MSRGQPFAPPETIVAGRLLFFLEMTLRGGRILSVYCSMMSAHLSIRSFGEGDSIPALTALLHTAYRALATKGFRYTASHQNDARTLSRLQSGDALVAELEGKIVGTATLYGPSPTHTCEWYRLSSVYRFGQFAVLPELQRQGIGRQLYENLEALARRHGAEELALDTAEGADHLRQWYERLGFRFIQFMSWEETNYRSVILSKSLVDLG